MCSQLLAGEYSRKYCIIVRPGNSLSFVDTSFVNIYETDYIYFGFFPKTGDRTKPQRTMQEILALQPV